MGGTSGRRVIYRGMKIDLALREVPSRDGGVVEREVVEHNGAAVMLPLLDDGRVVLIRNARYSVGRTLWELPAGTIAPGEAPEATAARELEEETGYRAGRIELVREWFVSPGVFTERMYLYVCRDLSPGTVCQEADEDLTTHPTPWSEAMAMLDRGEIEDAKTMLSLLLWERVSGRAGGGRFG